MGLGRAALLLMADYLALTAQLLKSSESDLQPDTNIKLSLASFMFSLVTS